MNYKTLITIVLILCMILSFTGCIGSSPEQGDSYTQITAEEAKEIMDNETGHVILDVRTEEEFAEGHIPGAILIPDYDISEQAETVLTDKDQTILVYCRSGNRSKGAAEKLAQLGYTNVMEFGGINDWPYNTEKDLSYTPCDKPGDEKFKQTE